MTLPGAEPVQALSGADRVEAFDRAEQTERDRPTANRSTDQSSVDCVCPDEVKLAWFYFGAHFRMSQYQIGVRQLSTSIHALPQPPTHEQPFKAVHGNNHLPVAARHWELAEVAAQAKGFSPPTLSDGFQFDAVLTLQRQSLRSEPRINGYTQDATAEPRLNNLLGYAYSTHVLRDMVVPHRSSGDFTRSCVSTPTKKLEPTEMMGVQLLYFVRARVDGRIQIRQVRNGQLGGEVTKAHYDDVKLANVLAAPMANADGDRPESGDLGIVPGIYTITVLVEDAGTESQGTGGFRLVEAYCDGDCLYGPDDT